MSQPFQLKRDITTWGLLGVSISAMIGSGWLFGPLYAAQLAGPAAMVSWLLGGMLVLWCVFCFAELSTMLPLVGGLSRFPHLTHGTGVGFTMSWLNWLAYVMVPPVEIQALLQYSGHYWPWLIQETAGPHGAHTTALSPGGLGVAAVLLLLLSVINILGVKKITGFNNALCYIKIGVPLGAVAILMGHSYHPDNFSVAGWAPGGWMGILSALPTAGVVFSFFGFNLAISLAGEVKNPQKTMPIALIGALGLCTGIYLLLQAGFILAVPPEWLTDGWERLHFPGAAGPFVGLALLLGLLPLAWILYVDAFLSPFGTSLIATLSNARSLLGMGVVGYFPALVQRVNAQGSPTTAIGINFILGITLLLPFPGWQQLAGFIIAALVLAHTMAPIALMALRTQLPDHPRPFRLPCYRLMAFTSFFILNLITYWGGWQTMWKMLVVLGAGYLFLGTRYAFYGAPARLDLRHAAWLLPYMGGLAGCSYLGPFGGGLGWLPLGWDFVAIGGLSALSFYSAARCARPATVVQAELAQEVHYQQAAQRAASQDD